MSYIDIHFDPKPLPAAVLFGLAVAHGADNFRCWLANRRNRRGDAVSGIVHEGYPWTAFERGYRFEIFGPSKEWVELMLARYMREYPALRYQTSVGKPEEEFDGVWSVKGLRRQEAI